MKRLISTQPLNTDVAALLLRLIVGAMFVRYGYSKFEAYDTILPMFGDIIGIGSKLSFNLVIFAELVCGFLVLIGLLTRYSIVPIFITMIVAFFVAHAKDTFDVKIAAFLYMVLCLPVFILGSGKYSVDSLIFNRKKSE
ncbi:putative oxidoreductase CatD [compost metagenome]